MRQAEAALYVDLEMGIEVVVAIGASKSARSWSRTIGAILELITENVGLIVREASAEGEPAAIISRADVPGVGCGAQESRMIRAARQAIDPRRGVAVVRGNAQTAEQAREEGKMLQISSFKSGDVSVAGVYGLRYIVYARHSWNGGEWGRSAVCRKLQPKSFRTA